MRSLNSLLLTFRLSRPLGPFRPPRDRSRINRLCHPWPWPNQIRLSVACTGRSRRQRPRRPSSSRTRSRWRAKICSTAFLAERNNPQGLTWRWVFCRAGDGALKERGPLVGLRKPVWRPDSGRKLSLNALRIRLLRSRNVPGRRPLANIIALQTAEAYACSSDRGSHRTSWLGSRLQPE